jgi:mRNA interferase MazF
VRSMPGRRSGKQWTMPPFRGDIRRGELYWADWTPARGSEQAGRRPALVVGADAGNRNERYPLTMVVAVSTAHRDILTHVVLDPTPENGLREASSAKCEQVMTISKERLLDRLGRVTDAELARIDIALKRALGII